MIALWSFSVSDTTSMKHYDLYINLTIKKNKEGKLGLTKSPQNSNCPALSTENAILNSCDNRFQKNVRLQVVFNRLPRDIVEAPSLVTFKASLD